MSIESNGVAKQSAETIYNVMTEVQRRIVGSEEELLVATGAATMGESALYFGPYGTGKTKTVNALATAIGGDFKRVQGVPDALPSDITGGDVFNQKTSEFEPHFGPVFADLVLADELPRFSSKTQAALLEAMAERQVTFSRSGTHKLAGGFALFATMNPVELRESSPVPGALKDRFMASMQSHLSPEDEMEVLRRSMNPHTVEQAATAEELAALRTFIPSIHVAETILKEIVELKPAVKRHSAIDSEEQQLEGARTGLSMIALARIKAASEGRQAVELRDVHFAAPFVFAHRIVMSEVALENDVAPHDVIREVVESRPNYTQQAA